MGVVDEVTRVFHEANQYRHDHLRKAIGAFEGSLTDGDALEKARSKTGRYADTSENRKLGRVGMPYKDEQLGGDALYNKNKKRFNLVNLSQLKNPQKVDITNGFNPPADKPLYLLYSPGVYMPVKFVSYNRDSDQATVARADGSTFKVGVVGRFITADNIPTRKTSKRVNTKVRHAESGKDKAANIAESRTLKDNGSWSTED